MPLNRNVGYGQAQINSKIPTTGKTFVVVGTSGASYQDVISLWQPDNDGVVRNFTTPTLALAQCVAGRGDVIILAPDFTTTFTAAEILSAETKGVTVIPSNLTTGAGVYFCERATATLPQSLPTSGSAIFTVTGKIKLLSIQGVITTVIQSQSTGVRLVTVPTVGTQSDLCTTADINAGAVSSILTILTTAGVNFSAPMINTANGNFAYQFFPVVVQAGTINLTTGASSTGSIKWRIEYAPMEPGARVFAA